MVSVGGDDWPCYWNMRFVCNFHDWEMEGVDSLMDLLYGKLPFAGGTYWVRNSNSEFSFQSNYEHLRNASRKAFSLERPLFCSRA